MNEFMTINQVTKKIKGEMVLENINIELKKGNIYGFIGHNGSGKTMLCRVILGLIKPTEGTVSYEKKDITFGATLENPGFILSHSGFQNLKLLASIRGEIDDEAIKNTMKDVGLDPNNKKTVKTYSLGMKQKLAIAQAVMESPDLLVLDEPTNGLDSDSVIIIRELIGKINREKNTTVILCSHNPDDIKSLCDEVMQMENGRIANWKTICEK